LQIDHKGGTDGAAHKGIVVVVVVIVVVVVGRKRKQNGKPFFDVGGRGTGEEEG
jgi:hypothetical protein